ncbi:MAG: ABC transporter permease, partial [Gammaproteobacteria bacterium]|nr:ABC transporter permease [Gammaproteobacteria bacterium]
MLITNYFTSGWRNIINHKLFSSINILGLAIGLAAVSLITVFVRYELSYDKFWQNADKIHRAHVTFKVPGRDPIAAVTTPGPMIHALKKDFSEIEFASRISNLSPLVRHQEESFIETVSAVDADFLNIFDFNYIYGDRVSALLNPHSIVLTESLANKYFGDKNPVNEILSMDMGNFKRDYKVTAVIKDLPDNTQLSVNGLILIDENDWQDQPWRFGAWFSVNAQTFFTLKDPKQFDALSSELDNFTNRNFPKLPMGGDDVEKSDFIELSIMSIKDLHLNSIGMGEFAERGSKNTVVTFTAIAILILIIASINFMNLSTARASQRAKEVSLRKVMGASRKHLIVQFLGESILITLISLILAIGLIELSMPVYNQVLGSNLALDYLSGDLLLLTVLAMTVGLLGGMYPAFVLSSFRPASVLKANKSAESSASLKLRYILVVVQFTVSISLFISTAVVYSQMKYAETMDAGFNKDNVLVVDRLGREDANSKREMLIKEISKMPNVTAVTWSNETPANGNENNTMVRTAGMPKEDSLLIGQRSVGYDFFDTYQIERVAGRSYQRDRNDVALTTDQLREGITGTSSLMLNESAVRRLGFESPEQAIGQSIFIGRGDNSENLEAEMKIIGVVADVHFESLRSTIRPEIYHLSHEWGQSLSIRYEGNSEQIVNSVKTLWQEEIPTLPFAYSFVADDVAEQYQTEQGQATMFAAFSGLAIFVASLGLYGLASFTAVRRTKEIGVRKVMGASVFDIVKLLVWQFSKPVLIANLIAWPVSFYFMSQWLQSFVYRIDNNVILGLSVIAALGALFIAWFTVAGNSITVAKAN